PRGEYWMFTRSRVVEPTWIEPNGIEPSGIEPSGIEPSGIEPSGIEPSGAPATAAEKSVVEPRLLPLPVQLIGGPASHVHQRVSVESLDDSPLAGGTGIDPSGIEPSGIEPSGIEPSGEFWRLIEPSGAELRRPEAVGSFRTSARVTLCSGWVASDVPASTVDQFCGGTSGIVESGRV